MATGESAEDATFFLATYDLGGRKRIRSLRSRFPYMPIAAYSEDPAHAAPARQDGADEHSSPNAYELAWLVQDYRAGRGGGASDDARFGERLIPGAFTPDSPRISRGRATVLPFPSR